MRRPWLLVLALACSFAVTTGAAVPAAEAGRFERLRQIFKPQPAARAAKAYGGRGPRGYVHIPTTTAMVTTPMGRMELRTTPARRYRTAKLHRQYRGEDKGKDFGEGFGVWTVKYLSEMERHRYEVQVVNGLVVDHDGQPIDTAGAYSAHSGEGRAIFVMDDRGRIFLSPSHEVGRFHHSSLVAGAPVASAGEILIDKGRIRLLTPKSGHYRPRQKVFLQVVAELDGRGADLSGAEIQRGF